MNKRSEAARRGLRIAAQVAAVGALAIATTSVAHGNEPSPSPSATSATVDATPVERAASILRIDGRAGSCYGRPVTWGPPAPPACTPDELARWASDLGPEVAA